MHTVAATDRERVAVLTGAIRQRDDHLLQADLQDVTRVAQQQRQRRVQHVRRRQAAVQQAGVVADGLFDHREERDHVVFDDRFNFGRAFRSQDRGTLDQVRDARLRLAQLLQGA